MATSKSHKLNIKSVLAEYPNLNLFGMGVPQRDMTLLNSFEYEFKAATQWLDELPIVKTKNPNFCTYELKHYFEKDTGLYTPVGLMVAALVYEEFFIKETWTPNPLVNISSHSINRIYKQHRREHLRVVTVN